MCARFTKKLCFFLGFFLLCITTAYAGNIKIVAGTSLIEDIARDLTGGDAEMMTMIPGSSCPGHETAKTSDFVFAANADLALVHAFQKKMPQLTSMMAAVKNQKLRLVVLEVKGSWLIPEVQKLAIQEIARALSEAMPQEAQTIAKRAEKRIALVDQAAAETLKKLTPLHGKAVAVVEMQAEFVTWTGLTIARKYNRPEEMNAKDLAQWIDSLRDRHLAGVIDNYQSGSDAGLPLALELKAPHIVLSNFPGSSDDATDYFSLLRHNVNELLKLGK